MMKFTLSILLLFLLLLGCESGQSKNSFIDTEKLDGNKISESTFKNTNDILLELRNQSIDSIIVYKRTCINCCDFRTIFWIKNGQTFYRKSADKSCLDSVYVKNESTALNPFSFSQTNLIRLKSGRILDNSFIDDSGEKLSLFSSHYCYSEIEIVTGTDTTSSGRMKDVDFLLYSGYTNMKGEKTKNIYYRKNIGSEWYKLLKTIEEIIIDSESTCDREKEIMRKDENATNIN